MPKQTLSVLKYCIKPNFHKWNIVQCIKPNSTSSPPIAQHWTRKHLLTCKTPSGLSVSFGSILEDKRHQTGMDDHAGITGIAITLKVRSKHFATPCDRKQAHVHAPAAIITISVSALSASSSKKDTWKDTKAGINCHRGILNSSWVPLIPGRLCISTNSEMVTRSIVRLFIPSVPNFFSCYFASSLQIIPKS